MTRVATWTGLPAAARLANAPAGTRSSALRQTPVRSRDHSPESRQATVRTAAQRTTRVRFVPTAVDSADTAAAQIPIAPRCG